MTSQLTPSLSHFLINLVKPYKKLLSTMALIGLCWALINTFTPYLLKLIIDHVVDFQGVKTDLLKTTQPYVFGYIGLWIALCFNMRLLD
jgi:ATP-binding cassette, subfamily B, bacterial